MAIGTLTMILGNVGLSILNNWRNSKQNAELQRKKEEFDRATLEHQRDRMWKLMREGQEITLQMEKERHDQRLKDLKTDFDNLVKRLAYDDTISHWPLKVLPMVMKNQALGNLLANQEEGIALHCILTPSNSLSFNRTVLPVVERELELFCNQHWNSMTTHPILFYSGAWNGYNEPTGTQEESLKSVLCNLPTLLITPYFPDEGKLTFKMNIWGVGSSATDKYENVLNIEPTDYQRDYTLDGKYDEDEELVDNAKEDIGPYLQCLVGCFADTYFWSAFGHAPQLPQLITNGTINTDGMPYLINDSRNYYDNLFIAAEEKSLEQPFAEDHLLNLFDGISSLWDKETKSRKMAAVFMSYCRKKTTHKWANTQKGTSNNNLLIDFYMNLLYISKEEFEVLKKNASTMLKQDLLKLSSEIRDNLLHSEDLKNMCAKNPSVSEDFNTLISEIRDYQQSIINTICGEELQSIDPNTIEINDFQNAKSSLVELSQTEIEMWSSLWENVENCLPKNGSVEQHISSLKTSVANCKDGKYTVMLMGEFQTGKTTTLNALCDGHYIGSVGIGTATTAVPVSVSYGESARVNIQWKNEDELKDMILHIKHLCSNNLFDNFVLSDKTSRSKLFSEIRLIIESKRDKLTSDEQKFLCVSYIILKYYNSAELQNLLGTECGIYNIAKFSKFPDDFEKNFNTYDVEDCLFVFIKQIDCFIPSKTLKQLECTIVDCPGLFKNQFDTEVTVDLMTRAHAIFYILPYHKAMDEKNCESLYTLKHSYKSFHRKIFLVNNLNSAKAGFFRQNVSEIHRLFGESTQLLPYDAHMALLGRIRDAYDSNSLDAKEIEMLLTKQESAFDFETLSFGSFKSDVNFVSWWNDEISTYKKIKKWDSIPVSENIVKQSGFSKVLDSLRSFIENNESLSVIWSQGIGKFWDELDDIKSSYKKTYVSPCLNGGEQEKTKWEERIAKAKTFQATVDSKTDEHLGDLSDEKSLSSLMARKEYENLFTEEFYSDLCNQIASAIYDQKGTLLSKKVINELSNLKDGSLEKRVRNLFSPIIESLVQDIVSKQIGLRLNYWYKTWISGQDEIFNTMFRPAVKTLKFDLEKEWNDLFYGDKDIKMKDYLSLDEKAGNLVSEKFINGEASVPMVEILSAYGKIIMNIVSIISSIIVIILCIIFASASNPVGWVAVALASVGYLLVTIFKGPDTIKNEFVESVSGQIKQQFMENGTYDQFRELVNHGVEDRINNFRNSLIVDVEKMEHEMIIALSTPESEKEKKCFAAIELFEIIKRQHEIYKRFFEKFGCKAK